MEKRLAVHKTRLLFGSLQPLKVPNDDLGLTFRKGVHFGYTCQMKMKKDFMD